MNTKRIIPCLDVDEGRVVKGVQFVSIRDAGDPAECARAYHEQGADELVFLDITASSDSRPILLEAVQKTAEEVFLPSFLSSFVFYVFFFFPFRLFGDKPSMIFFSSLR